MLADAQAFARLHHSIRTIWNIMDIKRFHVGKTLSEMAVHNGTVYLAGQIAEDTSQGIEGQTRDVLGQIDRLLEQAGSDKTSNPDVPDLHFRFQ